MLQTPDISVVIPTHNRPAELSLLIDSLMRQHTDGVRYEVIVVDNNSREDTRAVVDAALARGTPVALRYVREPRQGVSYARNTGIAHAKAAIVAFLDDDEEASADWVATVKRTFEEHPDIDCIGGPVRARWPHDPPRWLTREHFGPVAVQDEQPWMRLHAGNAERCLSTANFACRKEALDAVGGFDPVFVRNQDLELDLRLWKAGRQGLFTPELVVMTNVPSQRMTKAYHRRWNATRGHYRSMMRYFDRLDRNGRLVDEKEGARRFLGTPLFVYRRLFRHLLGWLMSIPTLRSTRGFYHETRVHEAAAYIATRYRMEYHDATIRAHGAEVARLLRYAFSRRPPELS